MLRGFILKLFIFAAVLLAPFNAHAVMVNSYQYATAGGGGCSNDRTPTILGSIAADAVADWDITICNSYDGTDNKWKNLEASPADSAAQTDYDLTFGETTSTSTDDPAVSGSPGSRAAYLGFDGGDFLRQIAANTTFEKDMFKSGTQDWTIVMAVRVTGSSNGNFISTQDTADTNYGGGVTYPQGSGDGVWGVFQGNNSVQLNARSTEGGFQADFDAFIAIAHNDTANTVTYTINGTEFATVSYTENTATNDPAGRFQIGGNDSASVDRYLKTGTRIYAISLFNDDLTTTEVGDVYTEYKARHNRAYGRYTYADLEASVSSIGLVACWDAGLPASSENGIGQVWKNLVASPADSSSASAYDLDAVNTVPWLNLPDPKWSPGASDRFTTTAAATAFVKNLHKTTSGQDFWFLAAINSSGGMSNNTYLMSNTTAAGTAGADGVMVGVNSAEDIVFKQNGTVAAATDATDSSANLINQDWLIIVSYDHTANQWKVWTNSTTARNVSQTFATSIVDAVGKLTIGAESDGGGATSSAVDWRTACMGNIVMDNTKAASIFAYFDDTWRDGAFDFTP